MFGQTFEVHDLLIIGLLVVLEGILSIDNALVLGVLARRLPKHQRRRALTYGLIGAFVFRFLAIGLAAYLIKITWIKLIGGAYLLFIAIKHFATGAHTEVHLDTPDTLVTDAGEIRKVGLDWRFWYTVGVIEITDIAFAIDSILAAVGLISGDDKTWVVIAGGFIGVIMMRFAAVLFIKLLERFPRFEHAAYLLVLVIGLKLVIDWASYRFHFHDVVNFHSPKNVAFWVFWLAMTFAFAVGFMPVKPKPTADEPVGAGASGRADVRG